MGTDKPKKRKKAANGGGSVERRGALYWVQVSLPRAPGEKLRRKRVLIPNSEKMTPSQAKREGAKIARDVRDGKIVEEPTEAKPVASGPTMTVRQAGEFWTSGKMYVQYGAVDGLAPRKSGYIDGKTLAKHVYKVRVRMPDGSEREFGDVPIARVTRDMARTVMGAQRPEAQALQTRKHTYNRVRQLFEFAEAPLGLRTEDDNPFTERLRPKKVKSVDVDVEFTYLYPSEAIQLAKCVDVLVARRVLYFTAIATGFDASTLPSLTWGNYDSKNCKLDGFRPKTGKAIHVIKKPAWLFDLLDAWRVLSEAPPADASREVLKRAPIFPPALLAFVDGRESEALQKDLTTANLTRAALFETTETSSGKTASRRMRFHDLRATFETWARRDGWPQHEIDARTGHGSKEMADRYDRGASSLDELEEVPFPDLARAMPEIRAVLEKRPRLHTRLHTVPSATGTDGTV